MKKAVFQRIYSTHPLGRTRIFLALLGILPLAITSPMHILKGVAIDRRRLARGHKRGTPGPDTKARA